MIKDSLNIKGRPAIILAPMEGITDLPFRILCIELGADLVYTEFISARNLVSQTKEALRKIRILKEHQSTTVIQLYGNSPELLAEAAVIAEQRHPTYIDLNFGCSTRKVTGSNCGSAVIKDLNQSLAICTEVVNKTQLPITVKTRLGYYDDQPNYIEHALMLQDTGIQAFCLHGRFKNQKYDVPADWKAIRKLKEHNDIRIPIIGNGDLNSAEITRQQHKETSVDALMIGRASLGNPWIFRQCIQAFNGEEVQQPTIEERKATAKRHLELNLLYKDNEDIALREIRKHYTNYFNTLPDFPKLKKQLMTSSNASEVFQIIDSL
ncbi:MAG: tRNA dihydrouridine synthase [Hyphomicrobiales bacterium]